MTREGAVLYFMLGFICALLVLRDTRRRKRYVKDDRGNLRLVG